MRDVATDAEQGGDALTGLQRARRVILVLVIVAAGALVGLPRLAAPWVYPAEQQQIAENPRVNADGADNRGALQALFVPAADARWQPLTTWTYRVEWRLSGGDPLSFRRTDLVLHIVCGLLVWWTATQLLVRWGPRHVERGDVELLAALLALCWVLHPAQVTVYGAQAARGTLLMTACALGMVVLYVRSVAQANVPATLGALLLFVLAQLGRLMPAWGLVLVAVEFAGGGRQAVRRVRLWLVAVLCLATAGWQWYVQGVVKSGAEESSVLPAWSLAVPLAEIGWSLLDLVAPLWVSGWRPAPRAVAWSDPLVWGGVVGLLVSLLLAWGAVRLGRAWLVLVALVWFWALLGAALLGGAEGGSQKLYAASPAIVLIAGYVLLQVSGARGEVLRRAACGAALLLAGVLVWWDVPLTRVVRGTLSNARWEQQLFPESPYAAARLAEAYAVAREAPLPGDEEVPQGEEPDSYFRKRMLAVLDRMALDAEITRKLPDPHERGRFRRKLAYLYGLAGDHEAELREALGARALLPPGFLTSKRVAHAQQALGDYEAALEAYARCEELLPDDPQTRAAHYTDVGSLLLFTLEEPEAACPRFVKAVETGVGPNQARLGLAYCMIHDRSGRYGTGAEGFELVRAVLLEEPQNVLAWLIAAEYHLLSHHWERAAAAYEVLLEADPRHYRALRGYHELCQQIGKPLSAVAAWERAIRAAPQRMEFRSYLAWALALAGHADADAYSTGLLERNPDDRFACLARGLVALRAGHLSEAVAWVDRAAEGAPIPEARALPRALVTLRALRERGELGEAGLVLEGALVAVGPFSDAEQAAALETVTGLSAKSGRWAENPAVQSVRDRLRERLEAGR